MTLRLTQEEGRWLRLVLGAYREMRVTALRRHERGTASPHEHAPRVERWRQDVGMATALMGAIDLAMRRRG